MPLTKTLHIGKFLTFFLKSSPENYRLPLISLTKKWKWERLCANSIERHLAYLYTPTAQENNYFQILNNCTISSSISASVFSAEVKTCSN